MAEGIVVMVTMLVFLGTTVYAEQAYATKLDQATMTRRNVLYYASHNCESELQGSQLSTQTLAADGTPTQTSNVLNNSAATADARVGNGAATAVNRSWNTASTAADTDVGGTAIIWPRTGGIQKTGMGAHVHTASWATCNEKRYDSPWLQLFQFGWDFLKSAGGLG